MRPFLAALMLIALPACSGLQVNTEQDWETDFASYRTYAWKQGDPARNPAVESQIQSAVDFELKFKGLQKVETQSSPDLYVSTRASVEEEGLFDEESHPAQPVGTLVIDLVDARSGKRVWRGEAAKVMDSQISEPTLRRVVRDIFRHYPRIG